MTFYKNILFLLFLTVAAPAQASSLADQAVEIPQENLLNSLLFIAGGPALGALTIKNQSILPMGGSLGYPFSFLANAATYLTVKVLQRYTNIHPAWGYALVPAILMPLPIEVGMQILQGKNPDEDHRKPIVKGQALLCAQTAILSPVLGLAAVGLADIVKKWLN